MSASPADSRLDRATVLALVAMSLTVFVIANDFTALSVAIPEIETDLEWPTDHSPFVTRPKELAELVVSVLHRHAEVS